MRSTFISTWHGVHMLGPGMLSNTTGCVRLGLSQPKSVFDAGIKQCCLNSWTEMTPRKVPIWNRYFFALVMLLTATSCTNTKHQPTTLSPSQIHAIQSTAAARAEDARLESVCDPYFGRAHWYKKNHSRITPGPVPSGCTTWRHRRWPNRYP